MIKRHRMILSKKTFLKKIRYISVCSKTLYIYIYIYLVCIYLVCIYLVCIYVCTVICLIIYILYTY